MEKVILGTITSVFGIHGEVKIHSNTDFAKERYQKGNHVTLYSPNTHKEEDAEVLTYKTLKGMDIVSFLGYDTPEKSEKLIGYQVMIDKPSEKLKEGQYYYADLLNCKVYYQGKCVGIVIDVFDSAGSQLLRIKREHKADLLYPFIARFIANVDIEEKKIEINPIDGMLA